MREWEVVFADAFAKEFDDLSREVQDELLAHAGLLRRYGPSLGRPYVDTLKGSRVANLKELRFASAGGIWRVAFAFDPAQRAVLLVAMDKKGRSERRFYQELVRKAERRFFAVLKEL